VNYHTVGLLWDAFEQIVTLPKCVKEWEDFTDLEGMKRNISAGIWQGWLVYEESEPVLGALTTLVIQPAITEIHWLWVGGTGLGKAVPYFHAINRMAYRSGARRMTSLVRPGLAAFMEEIGCKVSPKYWVEMDMPDERIH